ncbi:MAG: M16 family metallopeptidase, partial [Alphaproteobacteria bacterium]
MRQLAIAALFLLAAFGTSPANATQVERVRSPGGIEAWLVRDPSVPLLSVEFSFRGGSALDPQGREGLSGMTAALIDEGAGDLDSQSFQGRLEDLSIRLGFDAGQDTFRGRLKTLTANRDEAVRLLNLALTRPRFDAEPVERIRNQILAGIRARSRDPDQIAGQIWARAVFPHHPYGRPGEGTAASVAAISVADMRGLIRERFTRDRLIVGVSGDIEPAQLGPLLDAAFASLPATSKAATGVSKAKIAAAGETFVAEQAVPQSAAIFSQPGIARRDPDYYVAQVLNHILGGGGFTSRLYAEVREA